jgi:amino acid adenylation domain-containing protein
MEKEFSTIHELIEWQAATRPDGVFLISPETGCKLTFHGLQQQTRHISNRLRQMGLQRGDKVAFLLDNGLFTAQLFLGVMAGGFVLVPLNSRAGATTLAYTLEHCDAAVVFVQEQYDGLFKEATAGMKRPVPSVMANVDSLATDDEAASFDEPSIALKPDDVALLMYTSGSTGKPKAATHTHRTVLAHGANSMAAHQLTAADCSLLVLPLYHINAECVTLMPTLVSGGSVVIPHHFSVSQFWDLLEDHRCTWSAVVPTIISQLLDWKDSRADHRAATFKRIRFLRSSSAPLSPALHREFLDKFDLWLIQAMGCSEGGNVFSNPQRPGANKIGSPGLPWGFETRIINPEGQEVPPGEPGEVLLRGPALMKGYYKDPEGTATVVDSEGWFHTGDLAYRDPDGYFFVIGRSKELIIKGGVNIAPKQIDEVLESHPSVLEAAAVGVPDRYVGEDVVAFVVLRSGKTGDERELMTFCESRLGHFKTPTRIHFTADLPKGPSGKIQRLKLQEKVAAAAAKNEGPASNGEISPTDARTKPTPIEQTIASIWMELLKQPHVGLQSNFFSLGGHSLLAIQSLSKLREKLPIALSLSDFFENATVAQQAALIRKRLRPDDHSTLEATVDWEQEVLKQIGSPAIEEVIPPRDPSKPCPLSPAQERLWFMEQLNSGVPVYNESEAVRLEGKLNVEAMEQALNLIITRHEILRTTIKVINEQPSAVVNEGWRLKIKRLDLLHLSPEQREAEVERLLVEEPRQPYHLESEPGIRATLVQVGAENHVFILMMHHIICDWSSEGVLWRELSALYRLLLRGKPAVLPPLPIQHGDYAAWQKHEMAEGKFAKDLAYWKEKLQGAPALLELPADRPRPGVNSYRGARARFPMGSALVQMLRDCSRDEKVSLFTLFTAALDVLLFRYTGSEDISLGIPLADRDRPELQSIIGFLLHTHVLRIQLSGKTTFRELLAQVQKGVLDLYTHRAPPFDQVVNVVHPERNLSYTPLFQVMINWRDRDQQLSFIGMEGLAVKSLLAETKTSKFDLTFMLTDDEHEIWLEIEYNTDLFDRTRIDHMVGHYQTLMEGIVENPATLLATLPLLMDSERQQLLVDWNQTRLAYPKNRCLHELFEDRVKRAPDAVAVVFENERLTYQQLDKRANQLARHLQDLGVGPDALVGICVERSLEMVVGLLGVLKAGGAYVPMDPQYPKERIAFMLEDAQPKVLITQRHLLELLPAHLTRVVQIDADWPTIKDLAETTVQRQATPENLAYIIYTSGSTGKPKGVAIEHRSAVSFATWAQQVFTGQEFAGVLFSTSICFDLSVFELFATLANGGKVILAVNALALPALPAVDEVRMVNTVPSAIAELLRSNALPRSVITVNLAGEPLAQSLVDKLYEGSSVQKVYDLYGPTETTTYSTCTLRQRGGRTTIGRPIANTRIYIVDSQLQLVPIGIPGELLIGGVGLARGYYQRPELTSEKFVPDPFDAEPRSRLYKTGDLVQYLPDGNIEYQGRLDYQVKIRGFRIELGEIEAQLNQHPDIREAVVVAREDNPGDKRIVAYLTSKRGESLKTSELRVLLQTKLPEYMVPSSFVTLERFPLTPNGKVNRKALPKPEFESVVSDFALPRTATEITLSKIWCEILGLKQVGIRASFFETGGHSLLAMQLISRIKQDLMIDLPVRAIFQHPTIEALAASMSLRHEMGRKPELIQLSAGHSGPELIFLIDEGSLGLFKLAHLMEKDLPLYASVVPMPESVLKASVANRRSELPTMEKLAAEHVALIKQRKHKRPIIVGGHCFTGKLAFEVAHQLLQAGEQVEAVLMLDTWMMRPPSWWLKKAWLQAHLGKLLKQGPAYFWKKSRRRINLEKEELASRLKLMANGDFTVHVPWAIIQRIYRQASVGYSLKTLPTRGWLLVSQDDWESNAYRQLDNTLGSGKWFADGVEVLNVPGDHVTVLDESRLPELASCYKTVLKKIKENRAVVNNS